MFSSPNQEKICPSPQELINIFREYDIFSHVITMMQDILNKLYLVVKDLDKYSLKSVMISCDYENKTG